MRYIIVILFTVLAGCTTTVYRPPVDVTPTAPAPLPTAYQNGGPTVDRVVTSSYRDNHRLLFVCSGTDSVSVSADPAGLTVIFPRGTQFKPQAAYTIETFDFPCRYSGYTENDRLKGGLTVRFLCRPNVLVYPEFADGTLDLILR